MVKNMILPKQFLLLLAFVLAGAEEMKEDSTNFQELDRFSVILSYLNDQPSDYIYEKGRLIESNQKDDIIQSDIEADVICKKVPSDNSCTSGTLKCHSTIKKDLEDSSYQIISVLCVPKENRLKVDEPISAREENDVQIEVASDTNRPVDIPCVGCPFDLNVDAEGVTTMVDTALRHVESESNEKHSLVKILRLQQQVVAGVKYLMLLEIAPTTCPKDSTVESCPLDASKGPYVCEVEYWEQPWRSTGKNIVRNNCTVSQDYLEKQTERPAIKNENNEVNDDFLAELESQIIPDSKFLNEGYYNYKNEVEEPAKEPVVMTPTFVLNEGILLPENDVQEPTTHQKVEITEEIPQPNVAKVEVTSRTSSDDSSDELVNVDESTADNNIRQKRSGKNSESDSKSSSENSKSSISSESLHSSDEEGRRKTKDKKENNDIPDVEIKRRRRSTLNERTDYNLSQRRAEGSSSSEEPENSKSSEKSNSFSEEDRRNRIKRKSGKSSESDSKSSPENSKSEDSSDEKDGRKTKDKKQDDGIPEVETKRKRRSTLDLENLSKDEQKLLKKFAKKAAIGFGWDNVKINIVHVDKVKIDGLYYSMSVKIEKTPIFKKCSLLVHTDEDLSNPSLIKTKCDDKRARRGIPGGINEIEKDDPQVKQFLNDGLLHLDSQSSHTNRYKIKEIISASTQVVSGQLLRIKARIVLSDCAKNTGGSPEECGELEGADSRVCNFKIWNQPWVKNGRETTITCENENKTYSFRVRREIGSKSHGTGIRGGIQEQSGDHPQVQRFLAEGLLHLDSLSPHTNRYKIQEILSASSQVVAGSLWRVKAKVILSDCEKGDDTNAFRCGELQGAESKICNFKIWNRPWLKNGREINITCDDDDKTYSIQRGKRSLQDLDEDETLQEDLNNLFEFFTATYGKTYLDKVERDFRLRVFKRNMEAIRLLNQFEQGSATYGISRFADLTQEEFSRMHGLRSDLRADNDVPFAPAAIPTVDAPTEFDWRKRNAVTEVKDQGECGSCWAFSTTGNVEGQYAIKHGLLREFSEQELVDCDKLDDGCDGGLMDNAYRTIEEIGGLESEKDYPYEAEDEKCHFNRSKVLVKVSGAVNISHDEGDMAKWLVQNGPISIAINANAMQFYMGGVSWPLKFLCNPNTLDHGVLIVGYGVDNFPRFNKTLPYWIVKNSWGKSWGEQGYYRVYRGKGVCGVNQTPSSAIVV